MGILLKEGNGSLILSLCLSSSAMKMYHHFWRYIFFLLLISFWGFAFKFMYTKIHEQGALRNSITAFIKVSPLLKDAIWSYLEQYDLPVVTPPLGQHNATQVSSLLCCYTFIFWTCLNSEWYQVLWGQIFRPISKWIFLWYLTIGSFWCFCN